MSTKMHPARPRRYPQREYQLGTESRIQQLIILLNSLSSHLHSQSKCRWLFYILLHHELLYKIKKDMLISYRFFFNFHATT